MTHFMIRWSKRGEHIHARMFFATTEDATFDRNCLMIFLEPEWESFQRCFQGHGADRVTILPDDGEP